MLAPSSSHEATPMGLWCAYRAHRPPDTRQEKDRHIKHRASLLLDCLWGVSVESMRVPEDRDSSFKIGLYASFFLDVGECVDRKLALCLRPRFACSSEGRDSHHDTITCVFTFIFPLIIHRVGGRGRVAGKTRVTLSSSRLLPPRGQSQHVHHGRRILKTIYFVAAAADDSHGLLFGLCGRAAVVVAAFAWSRLEHGQRIALLWDRGTC